jgi:hypothetical protein
MTADRDVRDSLDWEVEAEKHKTDAEFWKHNAELRASEITRLTERCDAYKGQVKAGDEQIAALRCRVATGVVSEIAAERRRQVEVEGWTAEHDDEHGSGEMARAAAAYADHSSRFRDATELGSEYRIKAPSPLWPWSREWWKPKDRRRDLIRAAALIVAEIERLDRSPSPSESPRP